MALVIGPTFTDDLRAAGLDPASLAISWTADGQISGRENLTPQQNAAIDAALAAHNPNKQLVPGIISRRQFYQASALHGMITRDEALDAVRHGTIPAQMQQGIDTLSPDEKFAAEMLLSGAGEFDRHHLLVDKFGQIMGMTSAQVDDMWRFAAML